MLSFWGSGALHGVSRRGSRSSTQRLWSERESHDREGLGLAASPPSRHVSLTCGTGLPQTETCVHAVGIPSMHTLGVGDLER